MDGEKWTVKTHIFEKGLLAILGISYGISNSRDFHASRKGCPFSRRGLMALFVAKIFVCTPK